MTRRVGLVAAWLATFATPLFAATDGIYRPSVVATLLVDGIDSDGASQEGVFGEDHQEDLVDALAALLGIPTGLAQPAAPNQISLARFYGDTPPSYYTQQDIDDLNQVTAQWGEGVPRHALIMAKFAKHVMQRSGARQVNVIGGSFGGLITRWMVEKDVEGLVSSGKIARWITIEGVIAGNYLATQGDDSGLLDELDLDNDDVENMTYTWVEDNIHDDRRDADNPLLANVRIHHWRSTHDDMNGQGLSILTLEPNDGIQLVEDMALRNLTPISRNLRLMPMISSVFTTHESVKDYLGIRAGLAAELTGTRRVRIQLKRARVLDDHESSSLGDPEVVFGRRIRSPLALSQYGISDPIAELKRESHVPRLFNMEEDVWKTTNTTLFDDIILPGETTLRVTLNPYEIDIDPFYDVFEFSSDADQSFDSKSINVSTLAGGTYSIQASDWEAELDVAVFDYPPFLESNAARHWSGYE